MRIIVPKKITNKIFAAVNKAGTKETKGALFAKYVSYNCYEIEDVYISKVKGTNVFSILIVNCSYRKFEKQYFKKYNNDFENHNYIGDWHSHPLFECNPSNYDVHEAFDELENSNANFLIQLIVKIENNKLVGNCFLYKHGNIKKKCELLIEQD